MLDLTKGIKGVLTTSDWIVANDGHQYKAFFGFCRTYKAEDVIGCKTGSGQADFIIQVGTLYPLILPGCQLLALHSMKSIPSGKNIFEVV